MIIAKSRGSATNWPIYHISIGATQAVQLNLTNAAAANAAWNNTAPTSSVFTSNLGWNTTAVAYCFAPVSGYSAFGSYTGNGSTDGPFIFTGFRPRWLMYKNTTTAGYSWIMLDSSRSTINVSSDRLLANTSDSEASGTHLVDFLSNGFKIRNSDINGNASGSTYIYAVFAENPFKISRAR